MFSVFGVCETINTRWVEWSRQGIIVTFSCNNNCIIHNSILIIHHIRSYLCLSFAYLLPVLCVRPGDEFALRDGGSLFCKEDHDVLEKTSQTPGQTVLEPNNNNITSNNNNNNNNTNLSNNNHSSELGSMSGEWGERGCWGDRRLIGGVRPRCWGIYKIQGGSSFTVLGGFMEDKAKLKAFFQTPNLHNGRIGLTDRATRRSRDSQHNTRYWRK